VLCSDGPPCLRAGTISQRVCRDKRAGGLRIISLGALDQANTTGIRAINPLKCKSFNIKANRVWVARKDPVEVRVQCNQAMHHKSTITEPLARLFPQFSSSISSSSSKLDCLSRSLLFCKRHSSRSMEEQDSLPSASCSCKRDFSRRTWSSLLCRVFLSCNDHKEREIGVRELHVSSPTTHAHHGIID
jgi:hypothetical protein